MAISDKTRKFLWAKSGNRCAICKTELIAENDNTDNFNIGEECHIISSKTNGPRHISHLKDYDNYENLVLLCRNHHKEIDELVETYTEEVLRYIKINHTNWVKITINNAINTEEKELKFLKRVTSGNELFRIISGVYGYNTSYDDLRNKKEADFIGGFFQTLIDYGDIISMVDMYDKIKISYELQKLIERLEDEDYLIFAGRRLEPMFPERSKSEKWTVATIIVKKKSCIINEK